METKMTKTMVFTLVFALLSIAGFVALALVNSSGLSSVTKNIIGATSCVAFLVVGFVVVFRAKGSKNTK